MSDTPDSDVLHILFGGDVMLGRLVRSQILLHGAGYPLEAVADIMRAADLTIVNLECAITASTGRWPGKQKAFYFGAPPQAAGTLAQAGVDLVSLANNHTLDFDVGGLFDTLRHLRKYGIAWTGAGTHLGPARTPAIVQRHGIRVGMAAFCDHQPDFAATPSRPGIAYLDLNDEAGALAVWRKALARLRRAQADWPILSLHWGPNMVARPSLQFRHLARAAIDMGWKILFGHSAHVFHGIEIYRGCPIIYAAGDLVDDYAVDPWFRNDLQLLIDIAVGADRLRQIRLHPIVIDECRTLPAVGEQFDQITARMTSLCAELGTRVSSNGHDVWIDLPATPA